MPIQALELPKVKHVQEEIPNDAAHLHAISNPEEAIKKADNIFATNINLRERIEKRRAEMKQRANYLNTIINQKNNLITQNQKIIAGAR